MSRRPKSQPVKVAVTLKSVLFASTISKEAEDAIWEGIREKISPRPFQPHPACPCERCHRALGTLP